MCFDNEVDSFGAIYFIVFGRRIGPAGGDFINIPICITTGFFNSLHNFETSRISRNYLELFH
jgi:hypothetical protein